MRAKLDNLLNELVQQGKLIQVTYKRDNWF